MNRILIFDFDGVLANSLEPMLLYAQQACRELGVVCNPTRDDLEVLDKMEFSEYGLQLGVPAEKVDQFVMRSFALFSGREEPLPITPGMEAVVSGLAKISTLAIITGNSCRVVEKFLDEYRLRSKFQTILCAEHEGTRLEKILEVKNNANSGNTAIYMIGDAVSDIRAARAAEVKSIAVGWGHQSKQKLAQETPYLIVDRPEDLLAYFVNETGN